VLNKKEYKESGILYAVITTVLCYFIFKITLLFSMVLDRHSSYLRSIWSNSDSVINPFSAFLIVAVLSCIWFFYCTIKFKQNAGKPVYLLLAVGTLFYYFWFKGFYGLWLVVSYEQKQITLQSFFEKTNGTERFKYYLNGASQNIDSDIEKDLNRFISSMGIKKSKSILWCEPIPNCIQHNITLNQDGNGKGMFIMVVTPNIENPLKSDTDYLVEVANEVRAQGGKLTAIVFNPPGMFSAALKCKLTNECSSLKDMSVTKDYGVDNAF
jgi:uncharacterized membrane protein